MRKDFGSIGIDDAFQLKQQPIYVVTRRGRSKKSFRLRNSHSSLGALLWFKTFDRAGVPTHEGGYQKEEGSVIHFHRGEITLGYILASASSL